MILQYLSQDLMNEKLLKTHVIVHSLKDCTTCKNCGYNITKDMHTDRNFADSVQYNSAYTNHHLLLIFNHKIHNCELLDCVHMICAFTSINPLLSYLNNIYK